MASPARTADPPDATRRGRIKHALFVFAHQDDEVMVSPHLVREVQEGHRAHCVFLTNGRGQRGVAPSVRDEESRQVLASLGVSSEDVHFLGTREGIDDLELFDRLATALSLMEQAVGCHPIRRVYTLAWEGGHPDHDATHLVALAFAAGHGLLGRTWQFSAYHGRGLPWKLFRVTAPFERPVRRIRGRLSLRQGVRHALLCWRYPSQRRTWVGLFPELFLRRALMRQQILDAVDPRALRAAPHSGRLLYEKMFGESYPAVERRIRPFLERHLPLESATAP